MGDLKVRKEIRFSEDECVKKRIAVGTESINLEEGEE